MNTRTTLTKNQVALISGMIPCVLCSATSHSVLNRGFTEKVRENIERRENEGAWPLLVSRPTVLSITRTDVSSYLHSGLAVFERTGTRTLSELARSESNVNKTPQTAVLSPPKVPELGFAFTCIVWLLTSYAHDCSLHLLNPRTRLQSSAAA